MVAVKKQNKLVMVGIIRGSWTDLEGWTGFSP